MDRVQLALAALLVAGLVAGRTSGKLQCEDLPVDLCAFSVSSAGSRCVLEKSISTSGHVEFVCQTSSVGANEFAEWMETDECVQSCGLERLSVGISTDALVEKGVTKALCSHSCQNNCPNVIDLFTNLAAGEGVALKQVCELQAAKVARRNMGETFSFASLSGNTLNAWPDQEAAEAPSSSSLFTNITAPAPTPESFASDSM